MSERKPSERLRLWDRGSLYDEKLCAILDEFEERLTAIEQRSYVPKSDETELEALRSQVAAQRELAARLQNAADAIAVEADLWRQRFEEFERNEAAEEGSEGESRSSLECSHCGGPAIVSRTGYFMNGDGSKCMSCGMPGTVFCDENAVAEWDSADDPDVTCERKDCEDCYGEG